MFKKNIFTAALQFKNVLFKKSALLKCNIDLKTITRSILISLRPLCESSSRQEVCLHIDWQL